MSEFFNRFLLRNSLYFLILFGVKSLASSTSSGASLHPEESALWLYVLLVMLKLIPFRQSSVWPRIIFIRRSLFCHVWYHVALFWSDDILWSLSGNNTMWKCCCALWVTCGPESPLPEDSVLIVAFDVNVLCEILPLANICYFFWYECDSVTSLFSCRQRTCWQTLDVSKGRKRRDV